MNSLLSALLIFMSTTYLAAQDHAIDVGLLARQYSELLSPDDNSDVEMTLIGGTLGYTGYLGLWNASEIRIGWISTELTASSGSIESSETSSGVHFGYLTKWYINEELEGLGVGLGTELNLTKEVFILGAAVEPCYRFLLTEHISIEPVLSASFGLLSAREAFAFDSRLIFSYGGHVKVGYVF